MEAKEIEFYIETLYKAEAEFKGIGQLSEGDPKPKIKDNSYYFKIVFIFIVCFYDFMLLLFRLIVFKKKYSQKRVAYTALNFFTLIDGKLIDRILTPLFDTDIIYINQAKESLFFNVNGNRVYNLGGLVKFLSYLEKKSNNRMNLFKGYTTVNDIVLRNLKLGQEVYMMWFYDLNSLSIIFSKYREQIKLIEVQHGSIINYPPYSHPSPVKIADLFYVNSELTVEYLKNNLCRTFTCEYAIMPKYKPIFYNKDGVNILYASTVEINGLHSVMLDFLGKVQNKENLNLVIRLHPREREKKGKFVDQLVKLGLQCNFDTSEHWLLKAIPLNTIVISPWSSTLEEAYDAGITAVTIDLVGMNRFQHLLNANNFFYSDNLLKLSFLNE